MNNMASQVAGTALILLCISSPLHAEPVLRGSDAVSADVTVKGVIISPPPCTINNNNTIDVDFGNAVDIRKVDGKNYLKNIVYTVQCTGGDGNKMSLSIQGNYGEFENGTALETDHSGLGIALIHDGEIMKSGDKIMFTYPSLPVLQAVPVKKTNVALDTGAFSVGATMVVGWQ